jgi:hypothetical protein
MPDLIDALEAQHQQIVKHLEAIREAGFKRDVAVRELKAAKTLILAHLGQEDRDLYKPMLAHPEAQKIAQSFKEKMDAVAADVMAFFNRYDLDKVQDVGLEFSKDLGRLLSVLGTRVRQEESQLYPAFRQYGLAGTAKR